jgi:ubiquinone biosynthesis protein
MIARRARSDRKSIGRAQVALRAARLLILIVVVLVPTAATSLLIAATKGRAAGARHAWRRVTLLLELLGAAFVKAGQVVATRRDLLPPEACEQLSTLQESSSPMTAAEARRTLEAAFGRKVHDVFEDVEYAAVGTGSVACVYRARLRSGGEVALKLRRPGVERAMALDLRLIRAGSRFVARLSPFRGVPVTAVVDHACVAVFGQLDFEREAENLCLLRDNLAGVPRLWVPRVRRDLSVPGCIVMEFIDGLELDVADRCSVATRKRFAASALTAIYHMLFVDGFVHCDMHPGNLYFTETGQVVVLDAGFSVRLSDRLRRLFADFFLNMSLGEGTRCAEIVIESAEETDPDADIDGFVVRMADLVERNHRLSAKEFSLMSFATEMFDLQRRHGVHAAPELIFPLLSLLVIEGTIRELDPDVDFQGIARPMLMRGKFGLRDATDVGTKPRAGRVFEPVTAESVTAESITAPR